jgi:hypothetical protein
MAKVKISREGIGAGKKFVKPRRTKSTPNRPNGYQPRRKTGT